MIFLGLVRDGQGRTTEEVERMIARRPLDSRPSLNKKAFIGLSKGMDGHGGVARERGILGLNHCIDCVFY